MAILAPINLRTVQQDIGYGYVVVGWDMPAGSDPATSVKVYDTATGGTQQIVTTSLTQQIAIVPGGTPMAVSVKNAGGISIRSDLYTPSSAVDPVAPTAQQHLEAVFGPLPAGTRIGRVTSDPELVVQADGSVVPA